MRRRIMRGRGEDGAVALEGAIVLLGFLGLFLGGIEFASVLWIWSTMYLAADQAGRYAMVNPSSCPAGQLTTCVQTEAENTLIALHGVGIDVPLPTTAAAAGSAPATMTITLTYPYQFLVGLGTLNLSSQVTVPLD